MCYCCAVLSATALVTMCYCPKPCAIVVMCSLLQLLVFLWSYSTLIVVDRLSSLHRCRCCLVNPITVQLFSNSLVVTPEILNNGEPTQDKEDIAKARRLKGVQNHTLHMVTRYDLAAQGKRRYDPKQSRDTSTLRLSKGASLF
ncbi:hypothetical protein Q3G72_001566 [Acer saccharum]|nr:hypothetical protein Q3G72_001566 [Acer saccharum]